MADGTRMGILLELLGDRRVQMALGLWNLIHLWLLSRALRDIQRRDQSELRGGKWRWRVISLINPGGPIVYSLFGRR